MSSKIIANYIPELSSLIFGRTKPSMVTVNLTNQCDQHCIYCEIGQNQQTQLNGALTIDDLIWILDEMAINNMHRISLCGGEPFLFKEIIDIVAYAGKKNVKCSITTSGMTVHKLRDNELKVLQDCKTEINISIDSFQESILSYTRGTSMALPNALKSIQKLQENQISVTVLAAISKYNYHDLSNFISSAYEKGIKQVLFQPIIYHSNYPEQITINNKSQLNVGTDNLDKLMNELRNILRFERKHKIETNVYRIIPWIEFYLKTAESKKGWFFNDVLNKFFCREIYAIIDISYYGGIQPCGLALATTTLHNNRHKSLMAQWNSATEDIKNDLNNKRYHKYCNACCHHFSRNMLASAIRYPIKNRVALINILSLLLLRIIYRLLKKIKKGK